MFQPINIIFAIIAGSLLGVTCAVFIVWLAEAAFGHVIAGDREQWLFIGLSTASALWILPKTVTKD